MHTSQGCNCAYWVENSQGEMQDCPPYSYSNIDCEFKGFKELSNVQVPNIS